MGRSARPRLVDVAKLAGVSTATVSFVLNGARKGRSQPASPETTARVLQAASALGYVPNEHAQAIRRGYSNSILLALGGGGDPWGTHVARHVHLRALPHGMSTVTLEGETWFDFLQGFHPASAFITGVDWLPDGLERVEQLAANGMALVVFSTRAEATQFDVISSPATPSVFAAYEMLRARHDRVHLLVPDTMRKRGPGETRLSAFTKAVEQAGDDIDGLVYEVNTSNPTSQQAAAHEMFTRGEQPSAVICSNASLAESLRLSALIHRVQVPDELEIVAIGDITRDPSDPLGQLSYYGTPSVFERIGDIVVHRALRHVDPPFKRHEFVWEYHPGSTTLG